VVSCTRKDIIKNNEWYIDGGFLLEGRTFANPTRLPKKDLRAYWQHSYDVAKSGQHFTFEWVGSYQDEDEDLDGAEKATDKVDTPKHCKSDEERISFLYSLLPQYEKNFHSIINTVAPMEVCCRLLITFLTQTL